MPDIQGTTRPARDPVDHSDRLGLETIWDVEAAANVVPKFKLKVMFP